MKPYETITETSTGQFLSDSSELIVTAFTNLLYGGDFGTGQIMTRTPAGPRG